MLRYLGVFVLVIAGSIAYAEPQDNPGQGQGRKESVGKKASQSENQNKIDKAAKRQKDKDIIKGQKRAPNFSNNDRDIIINYFNTNPFSTSSLPPGIAMNVARGKPLPPGIDKRNLPNNLLNLLPNRPGFDYFVVGNDVVLVDSTTKVVADIIENALRQ